MATVFYGGHLAKGPIEVMEPFYRGVASTKDTRAIIPPEQVEDYCALHSSDFTAILWAESNTPLSGIEAIETRQGIRMFVAEDDFSSNKEPIRGFAPVYFFTQASETRSGGNLVCSPYEFSRTHGFFPRAGPMTDITLGEFLGHKGVPQRATPDLNHIIRMLESAQVKLRSR